MNANARSAIFILALLLATLPLRSAARSATAEPPTAASQPSASGEQPATADGSPQAKGDTATKLEEQIKDQSLPRQVSGKAVWSTSSKTSWLVAMGAMRYPTRGDWELSGRMLRFHDFRGNFFSIRTDDIDWAATRDANGESVHDNVQDIARNEEKERIDAILWSDPTFRAKAAHDELNQIAGRAYAACAGLQDQTASQLCGLRVDIALRSARQSIESRSQ